MKSRVHKWAEKLDLLSLLSQRPQDLSGGQKQRVSLAGVLIDESPILLFDEPLANLDPKSGQDIIELIDQIHKEEGTTTLSYRAPFGGCSASPCRSDCLDK